MKELIERNYINTPMTDKDKKRAESMIIKHHKAVNYRYMYQFVENNRIQLSIPFVHEVYTKHNLSTDPPRLHYTHERNQFIRKMSDDGLTPEEIQREIKNEYNIHASLNTIKRKISSYNEENN